MSITGDLTITQLWPTWSNLCPQLHSLLAVELKRTVGEWAFPEIVVESNLPWHKLINRRDCMAMEHSLELCFVLCVPEMRNVEKYCNYFIQFASTFPSRSHLLSPFPQHTYNGLRSNRLSLCMGWIQIWIISYLLFIKY